MRRPVRRRALPPVALALLAAAPAAAQDRPRTYADAYVEADQVLAADLNRDDTVTYTALAAGVEAGVSTARAQGQVAYRYEHRFGWGDRLADDDIHTGLARGLYRVTRNLSVEGGAIATRARSQNGGDAPGVLVGNVGNTSQLYSLYAGPSFADRFGVVDVDAAYRVAYTKAEVPSLAGPVTGGGRRDYYDDALSNLLVAGASVRPGLVLPVGLSVSAAYDREDAGQLDGRYEGWYGRGDVLWPVSPTVALTAGAGYERIETSGRDPLLNADGTVALDRRGRFRTDPASPRRVDYRTDGLYYDAGVVWRPNARTRAEAHVGHRYGGTAYTGQLTYEASRGVSVGVRVYDGIETFGRQLRDGLSGLPTQFISARDQFTQQYNGCVFSNGGQSPGGCLNDVFQSIQATSYRARGADAVVSVSRGPNTFGAGAGYANRRVHDGRLATGVVVLGLEDESAYADLFYARALTRDSGVSAQLFGNWYRTDGVNGAALPEGYDGDVWSAGVTGSYYHRFGRLGTVASAGLYTFKVGDFDNDWSAQALLGARYTF